MIHSSQLYLLTKDSKLFNKNPRRRRGALSAINTNIKSHFYKNKKYIPCFYCGEYLLKEDATLEHLKPLSHGGTYDISNLAIACYKCNNGRNSSASIARYKKRIQAKLDRIVPDPIIDIGVEFQIRTTPKRKKKKVVYENEYNNT